MNRFDGVFHLLLFRNLFDHGFEESAYRPPVLFCQQLKHPIYRVLAVLLYQREYRRHKLSQTVYIKFNLLFRNGFDKFIEELSDSHTKQTTLNWQEQRTETEVSLVQDFHYRRHEML